MVESLTYAEALKILGHREGRLVRLLDAVATLGLAGWSVTSWMTGTDPTLLLNLFDFKNETVRLAGEALRHLAEGRGGLSRYDRSQRLVAAHAVLVVSSYFEALDTPDLPVGVDRFGLTPGEKLAQASGGRPPEGYAELVEGLLCDRLPAPEPHRPYVQTRATIGDLYQSMSRRLSRFVPGLAAWHELSRGEQTALREAIQRAPETALARYDEAFRRLAADNREFEIWANLLEAHALGAGLIGMSTVLTEMAGRHPGDRPVSHLRRGQRAALTEPVIATGQAPEGVVLPALGDIYINPRFKVAEVGPNDKPELPEWWEQWEVLPHVDGFLAGYLTAPRATRAPLVVLGEPGSGKSKLTEVLAARLPETEFLPIRVELRDVAAESMVHEQIEQAIYRDQGERAAFHDLLEATRGALPVVILDGFDELLQAAEVNRYDYLEQVRDFQRRQAAIDHPVAVIVTSRTVVADRVRFPAETVAAQIQPFDDEQIRLWLEVWRRHNEDALAARGLQPLSAERALAHRELAEQPLLLLMLAIFDATRNALQVGGESLDRAGLYTALLMDFASREVEKSPQNRSLPTARQRRLAERELTQLGAVALGMFARSRQAISEPDLDRDLPTLLPERGVTDADAALSPSQRVTGRFFFIHTSHAQALEEPARSYEFLHPTFAEFLFAWLAVRALRDLAAVREMMEQRSTAAGDQLDDGFLYAVLSFTCLAVRAPIVDFVADLLGQLPHREQEQCRGLLPELLTRSLYPHPSRSYQSYEPARYPIPRRLAAYSANLALLLVLLRGEASAEEMFGGPGSARTWLEHARLWQAQLSYNEWNGLRESLRVQVRQAENSVAVTLRREDGSDISPLDSLVVTVPGSRIEPKDYEVRLIHSPEEWAHLRFSPSSHMGHVIKDMGFAPFWRAGLLVLQATPFLEATGGEIRWQDAEDSWVLPAYLLARLDHTRDAPPAQRSITYRECLEAATPYPELVRQVLLRLREEVRSLPPSAITDLLRTATEVRPTRQFVDIVNELWLHLTPNTKIDNGRDLLIAIVKAAHKKWPNEELTGLSPKISLAVSAKQSNPVT